MKISFLIWINLCLTIILSSSALAVSFNEIMYNPPGNDNNAEFIELLSNGSVDLSSFIFGDLIKNSSMSLLFFNNESNYTLIVEEGFNYTGLNCSIYTAGKSIGDDLGNSGDSLFIYLNNGTLIDLMSYDNTLANGNGKSLEFYNNSWYESRSDGGTPCGKNSYDPSYPDDVIFNESQQNSSQLNNTLNITFDFIIHDILYTGVNYTSLFKITNKNYKNILNITLEITITGEDFYQQEFIHLLLRSSKRTGLGYFLPDKAGDYVICGFIYNNDTIHDDQSNHTTICKEFTVLDISRVHCDASIMSFTDAVEYLPGQKISIFNRVIFSGNVSFPYTLDYWIEDPYGKVVKKRTATANSEKKSWTVPSKAELQLYLLKSSVHTLCNNSNPVTTAESLFYAVGERLEESTISIEELDVPEEGAVFGKHVKASIHLYKGNTSRSSVHFYLASEQEKKVSEVIKLQFFEKYKDVTFDISLNLENDCELQSENYFFVADGFGLVAKKPFPVKIEGECTTVLKADKNNEQLKIKSFYTRTKNIGEQLNLYSTIRGNGTADVILYSQHGKQQKRADLSLENSFSFLVNTSEGNNWYILQLVKNNKTVDVQELAVYRKLVVQSIQKTIPLGGYIQNKKYLQSLKQQMKQQIKHHYNDDSSNARYVSTSAQKKNIIVYLFFGGITLLIVIILIFSHKVYKQ